MSIEAKINEEAQLDQAEALLSEEQLSAATGGAAALRTIDTRVLSNLGARDLTRTLLNRGDLLRNLSRLHIVSNKEWQE